MKPHEPGSGLLKADKGLKGTVALGATAKPDHPFAFNIRIDSDLVAPGRIALGGIQTISDTVERPGKSADAE